MPRGRQYQGSKDDRVVCQIRGKPGHPASRCWYRYSEDEVEEEEQMSANRASYEVDTNWYGDSGATNHVTGELDKLALKEKYHDNEKMHTASGSGMSISHVGHAFF